MNKHIERGLAFSKCLIIIITIIMLLFPHKVLITKYHYNYIKKKTDIEQGKGNEMGNLG